MRYMLKMKIWLLFSIAVASYITLGGAEDAFVQNHASNVQITSRYLGTKNPFLTINNVTEQGVTILYKNNPVVVP